MVKATDRFIIGADEVGTGALAGPLFVCAFFAPASWEGIDGLNDSKQLTAKSREKLYNGLRELIFKSNHQYGYCLINKAAQTIDTMGVRKAVVEGFEQAIIRAIGLCGPDSKVIIDGDIKALSAGFGVETLIEPKADTKYPTVMAASVVAKHVRDTMMTALHQQFPLYGFNVHKGYGTKAHYKAISSYGPCALHRKSFSPFKEENDRPQSADSGASKREHRAQWRDSKAR